MDRVALITGSTNNIGRGIAETLSREGSLVIITSRHENEAKQIADHLPAQGGYYQVDFSDAGQIAGLFSFIQKSYGRLDVLVNNVAHTENESIMDCTSSTSQSEAEMVVAVRTSSPTRSAKAELIR